VKNVDLWVLDEVSGALLKTNGTIYKGQHVISFDLSELGFELPKGDVK